MAISLRSNEMTKEEAAPCNPRPFGSVSAARDGKGGRGMGNRRYAARWLAWGISEIGFLHSAARRNPRKHGVRPDAQVHE